MVDHNQPHHGDMKLFWNRTNWQSLCKHCHDAHKQRFEKSGVVLGCTAAGDTVDPNHPWNQGRVGSKFTGAEALDLAPPFLCGAGKYQG